MAYLILDLDETVIKHVESEYPVHPDHILSPNPCRLFWQGYNHIFHIINREKISALIQSAYTDHDGVIIMTSGVWPKEILAELTENLNLTEEVSAKMRECRFHSAITDAIILNKHPIIVQLLPKGVRFKAIIEKLPELRHKNFVMLDNDAAHLRSFNNFSNVTAVLATTETASMKFYQEATEAMDAMKLMEIADDQFRKESMDKRDAFFSSESPKAKRRAPCASIENLPATSLDV